LRGVNSAAIDNGGDHLRRQVVRADRRERTGETPNGGANGVHNDNILHESSFLIDSVTACPVSNKF
jgi:hypothetical protein